MKNNIEVGDLFAYCATRTDFHETYYIAIRIGVNEMLYLYYHNAPSFAGTCSKVFRPGFWNIENLVKL